MLRLGTLVAVLAVVCLAAAAAGVTYQGAKPSTLGSKPADDEASMRSVLPEAGCGVFTRHAYVSLGGDTLIYYRGYRSADTTDLVGYVVKTRGRGYAGYVETLAGIDLYGRIVGLKVIDQKETAGLGEKIVQVKPAGGGPWPARIAVALDGPASESRCLVVGVRDVAALSRLEKAVADRDTALATELVPRALTVSDTTGLSDGAIAVALAERLATRLRDETVPWWQIQFVGKSAAQLVLSRQKDDLSIQGITGATVSCRAVVDPLKNAVTRLEQAVAGFKQVHQ